MNARLLRPVAACLALAAVSGAMCGCGIASPSISSRSASARTPITKAEATAFARAVNLRAGDIPLGSVFSAERERTEPDPTRSQETCFGSGGNWRRLNRHIINRESATLGWNIPGEFQRIYSAVEVLPSVALTVRHNAVIRSRRFLTCSSRFLHSEVDEMQAGRAEYASRKMFRLPDPLPGIEGGYEYRIAATIIAGRAAPVELAAYVPQQVKQVRLFMDLFGFISGPTEINLAALGGPRPVSKKLEERLLVLLYSRAEAHKHTL